MKVTLDPEAFTMGDIEDLEAVTGERAEVLIAKVRKGKSEELSQRELNAIVWVSARKDDPSITYEDVRNSRIVDLELTNPPAGANGAKRASNGSLSSRSTTGTRRKNSGT